MATKKIRPQSKRGTKAKAQTPIERAAERLHGAPQPALERADVAADELARLREIAKQAADLFESGDDAGPGEPERVLREALRSTQNEIGIIAFTHDNGGGVFDTAMACERLERRIDLALAVYEYERRAAGGAS
jgi:hypothetical protein